VFIRTQTNGDRTYLLLVENERVDGRLVQRVLYRLDRLDQLQASGQLDSVVKSLSRFSEKLLVLDAHARGESIPTQTVTIGPALILERLWRECGIADVLAERVGRRRFGFSVERAIFLTVLHRLFAPGSDRAAERWRHDYAIPGTTALELHQLYRAMRWLGTPLPKAQQAGATPFTPRTTKDLIEEALFTRPAMCSASCTWCSSTRRRSISMVPGATRSAGMAIPAITGPTSNRWSSAWCWTTRADRSVRSSGRGTRPMSRR
jgi:hypothetical protein